MNRAQRRKAERLEKWEAEKKLNTIAKAAEEVDTGVSSDIAPQFVKQLEKYEKQALRYAKTKADAEAKLIGEQGLSKGQYTTDKPTHQSRQLYNQGEAYEVIKLYEEAVAAGIIVPESHFADYREIIDWMDQNFDVETMMQALERGEKKMENLRERGMV